MLVHEVSPGQQAWTISSVLLFNVACGMMVDESFQATNSETWQKEPPALFYDCTAQYVYFLGLLCSALLMNRCGRRTAYLAASLSAVLSWMAICLAYNEATFAVGQTCGDFAKGAGIILGAMIIGEYTDTSYRGVFLTLASACLAFGKMTACITTDLRMVAMFALIPSVLSFVIACSWPESPPWLLLKKKDEESEDSFIIFKGTQWTQQELFQIQYTNIARLQTTDVLRNVYKSLKNIFRPLVVIMYADILMEASGKHLFEFYGSHIFDMILGESLFNYNLFINIIVANGIVISTLLIIALNRKTVVFLSGVMGILVLFLLSVVLFLTCNNSMMADPWVIISIIAMFIVLTNLGCTTICLTWCGELFPIETKSYGLFLSGVMLYVNKRICSNMMPYLLTDFKLLCAVGLTSLTLSLLILYFIAPETKDRSLSEIEYYFENGDFEDYEEADKNVTSNI
ncbi:glucose transporter GlcP-like [Plodia interpunctella]|uniref:glucose transporter GlcP-like n=1 Tax=Plodia interpunctella TaxID=58824 RepID=UPI00236782B0|nr:glucose transporter GlcP-like [Plodia interpunctella]